MKKLGKILIVGLLTTWLVPARAMSDEERQNIDRLLLMRSHESLDAKGVLEAIQSTLKVRLDKLELVLRDLDSFIHREEEEQVKSEVLAKSTMNLLLQQSAKNNPYADATWIVQTEHHLLGYCCKIQHRAALRAKTN